MDTSQRRILTERLLAHREVDPVTGCWLWTLSCKTKGYGQTSIPGTRPLANRMVHRIAAALWLGFDLDSDLLVIHSCDTPRCFNPEHLRPATAAENTADMIAKRRESHNTGRKGEAHYAARLTEAQVVELRRRREAGETYEALGAAYGITAQGAFRIVKRLSWKHV